MSHEEEHEKDPGKSTLPYRNNQYLDAYGEERIPFEAESNKTVTRIARSKKASLIEAIICSGVASFPFLYKKISLDTFEIIDPNQSIGSYFLFASMFYLYSLDSGESLKYSFNLKRALVILAGFSVFALPLYLHYYYINAWQSHVINLVVIGLILFLGLVRCTYEMASGSKYSFLYNMLLVGTCGYLSLYALDHLTTTYPILDYLYLPIFLSVSFLVLVLGLSPLENLEISIVSRAGRKMKEVQTFIFVLGVFIGFYVQVRGLIFERYPIATLLEWIPTLFLVGWIYSHVKKEVTEGLEVVKLEDWKRHVYNPKKMTDESYSETVRAQEDFLEHGSKELLLVLVVNHMTIMGESTREISSSIAPLVDYEDDSPLIPLGWLKKRVKERNRKNREKLLNSLVKGLEKYPNNGKLKGGSE